MDKQSLIDKYRLQPHPEGGYYSETYRSEETYIPACIGEERNLSTAIYFMLEMGNFSAFHRIQSDEVWHHYFGATIAIHVIDKQGNYERKLLGTDMEIGSSFQHIVPAGAWFASEVFSNKSFALVGCTVSFGFDFKDFEMAELNLIKEYPEHEAILNRLIRKSTV